MFTDNLIVLNDFLGNKIDLGQLFVECLSTVQDDLGIYALEGLFYEVLDMDVDSFYIDTGFCTLQFKRCDSSFRLFICRG